MALLAVGIACDTHLSYAATQLGLQNFKTLSRCPTFNQRPRMLVTTQKGKCQPLRSGLIKDSWHKNGMEESESPVDEDGT